MEKIHLEIIEKIQCPGCSYGSSVDSCNRFDFKEDYGFRCNGHAPGSLSFPGGRFFLGLPKGFNKVGARIDKDDIQYSGVNKIRLWLEGQLPEWDHLNVPVWAMEKDGFLFVRTFCPRIDLSYIDVILKGTLDMAPNAINVSEFEGEID